MLKKALGFCSAERIRGGDWTYRLGGGVKKFRYALLNRRGGSENRRREDRAVALGGHVPLVQLARMVFHNSDLLVSREFVFVKEGIQFGEMKNGRSIATLPSVFGAAVPALAAGKYFARLGQLLALSDLLALVSLLAGILLRIARLVAGVARCVAVAFAAVGISHQLPPSAEMNMGI